MGVSHTHRKTLIGPFRSGAKISLMSSIEQISLPFWGMKFLRSARRAHMEFHSVINFSALVRVPLLLEQDRPAPNRSGPASYLSTHQE